MTPRQNEFQNKQTNDPGDGAPSSTHTNQAGNVNTIEFSEYFSIILRQRWTLIATATVILLLGMIYTIIQRPQYKSTANVLVTAEDKNISSDNLPVMNTLEAVMGHRSVTTQAAIMSSDELLQGAYMLLSPRERLEGFQSDQLPSWAVRVAAKKESDIIQITTYAYTPDSAATLANTIAQMYLARDLDRRRQVVRDVRQDLERDLQQMRTRLKKDNAELLRYQKQTGLIDPDTQVNQTATRLSTLQSEIGMAQAQAASTRQAVGTLYRQLQRQGGSVIGKTILAQNPQFLASLTRIDQLRGERIGLEQEYTEGSAEVKGITSQIKNEQRRLSKIAATIVTSQERGRNPLHDELYKSYAEQVAQLAANEARVRTLTNELSVCRREAATLPDHKQRLVEMQGNIGLLKGSYDTIWQRFSALRVSEKTTLPSGQVISKAQPVSAQDHPNIGQNAVLFALLGLIIGVMAAIRAERAENTQSAMSTPAATAETRTPGQFESPLAQPALAVFPPNAPQQPYEPISPDSLAPASPSLPNAQAERVTAGKIAVIPQSRCSFARKHEAVMRLIHGEESLLVAREMTLDPSMLERWRKQALRGIDRALREREETIRATYHEGEAGLHLRELEGGDTAALSLDAQRTAVLRLFTGESVAAVAESCAVAPYLLVIWQGWAMHGIADALRDQDIPEFTLPDSKAA